MSEPPIKTIDIQLDFIKQELDHISVSIARIDQITQTTKNWAVVTWAGSIALIFGGGAQELKQFVSLTAIIPTLFWFIDAWWRRIQRRFGYRSQKISEFLNSEQLTESIKNNRLVNFKVYDPTATQYRGQKEYKKYISSAKTFRFREVALFYLGLIVISIILWLCTMKQT
ncbi:hypothetical protein [Desulfuromonas acetoxidans]|uniref:hypothetical protein n=1 Tax=Desulfuromonas acetoxidans TaxID=891 RepID=UPI00292CDC6B|nr:hypothetical protein [Desulfuromonas acetoxidans]